MPARSAVTRFAICFLWIRTIYSVIKDYNTSHEAFTKFFLETRDFGPQGRLCPVPSCSPRRACAESDGPLRHPHLRHCGVGPPARTQWHGVLHPEPPASAWEWQLDQQDHRWHGRAFHWAAQVCRLPAEGDRRHIRGPIGTQHCGPAPDHGRWLWVESFPA